MPSQRATAGVLPASFFDECALLCVDIQQAEKRLLNDESEIPKGWATQGFTLDDVNAAVDFAFDVALPNAVRVADACRQLRLPRIFIHWGYRLADGMDLEPSIREMFQREHGTDYTRWGGHVDDPGSRVASALGVRPDDYVVSKTGQDAFDSSTLPFLLRNLGVRRLVMMGGHTGACLGRTAASALQHDYEVCIVEDATNDARESARLPNLERFGYDHRVSTDQFVSAVTEAQRGR